MKLNSHKSVFSESDKLDEMLFGADVLFSELKNNKSNAGRFKIAVL